VKAELSVSPKAGSNSAALKASMTTAKAAVEQAVLVEVKKMATADPTLLAFGKTVQDLAVTATDPVEVQAPTAATTTPLTEVSAAGPGGTSLAKAACSILTASLAAMWRA